MANKELQDYNQAFYHSIAAAAKQRLERLIKESGIQRCLITYRAKNATSLERKLLKNQQDWRKMNDLAGCRVMFYTLNDLEKFQNFLYEKFGDDNITKHNPHYSPDQEVDFGEGIFSSGHISENLTIQCNDITLADKMIDAFNGQQCEIQLTTILFHPWSEVEHDLLYKAPEVIDKKYPEQKALLASLFKKTMSNIKEAQRTLDYIDIQHARLIASEDIFKLEWINQLPESNDNNQISDNLSRIEDNIDLYRDEIIPFGSFLEELKNIFLKVIVNKPTKISTPWGEVDGVTSDVIVKKILGILHQFRAFRPKEVFNLYVYIYLRGPEKSRADVLSKISSQVEFDLGVIKNVGFYVQDTIIDNISSWDAQTLEDNFPILEEVTDAIFKHRFFAHNWKTENSVEWEPRVIVPSTSLKEAWCKIILILKKVFNHTTSVKVKNKCIELVADIDLKGLSADNNPNLKEADQRLLKEMIIFFEENFGDLSIVAKLKIEESLANLLRNISLSEYPHLDSFVQRLLQDEAYQFARDYVGYDGRKYTADLSKEQSHEQKVENILHFVDHFDEQKVAHVVEEYNDAVAMGTGDGGLFGSLHEFFTKFAERYPKRAEKLLGNPFYNNFFGDIFLGLLNCGAAQLFEKYYFQKKYILSAAGGLNSYSRTQPVKLEYLILIHQALNTADAPIQRIILRNILETIANRQDADNAQTQKKLFFSCIHDLQAEQETNFFQFIYFRKEMDKIVDSFDEDEAKKFLDAFKELPRIDYHFENVIKSLLKKYPQIVINFFIERLDSFIAKQAINKKLYRSAQLVPDREDISVEVPKEFIDQILAKLENAEDWYSRNLMTELLAYLFPLPNKHLIEKIKEIIKKDSLKQRYKFILQIVDAYSENDDSKEIAKELLQFYGNTDEVQSMLLSTYFSSAGGTGEYAIPKSQAEHLKRFADWKGSTSEQLREFYSAAEQYTKSSVISSTKRADKDLATRKLDFESTRPAN